MLVCLRNNKRTESNTEHPALVDESRQAVRASSGNQCDRHVARPELRPKKIGYANAYEISFSRWVFLCFHHKHCIGKHKTPHNLFHFNMQRIQVLRNHIAVLIALLTHRWLTQSKYCCTFLLRLNNSCACSFRWISTLICTRCRHQLVIWIRYELFVNFQVK